MRLAAGKRDMRAFQPRRTVKRRLRSPPGSPEPAVTAESPGAGVGEGAWKMYAIKTVCAEGGELQRREEG